MKSINFNRFLLIIFLLISLVSFSCTGSNVSNSSVPDVNNLSATPEDSKVILKWEDPKDATVNHIEILNNRIDDPALVPIGKQQHIWEGLENCVEYIFTVKAVVNNSTKSNGISVKAMPLAKEIAEVSEITISSDDKKLTLSWIDPTDKIITGIEITSSSGAKVNVSLGKGTYTFDGLENGVEYTFTVKTLSSIGKKSNGISIKGVPFFNYKDENGKLDIQNNINEKIIIFANKLEKANVLGELQPFQKQRFRMPSDDYYIVKAIVYGDYLKNLADLSKATTIFFSDIVYYDSKRTEAYTISISSKPDLSGKSLVIFQNNSKLWVELRKTNPDGEALVILPPQSIEKYYNIRPDAYDLFPVFKFPVYEIKAGGKKEVVELREHFDITQVRTFQVYEGETCLYPVINKINITRTHSKGYLKISNLDDANGFRVFNGATLLRSVRDREVINYGTVESINLVKGTYNLYVKTSNRFWGKDGQAEIPLKKIENGYVYNIEINKDGTITVYDPELPDDEKPISKARIAIRPTGTKTFTDEDMVYSKKTGFYSVDHKFVKDDRFKFYLTLNDIL